MQRERKKRDGKVRGRERTDTKVEQTGTGCKREDGKERFIAAEVVNAAKTVRVRLIKYSLRRFRAEEKS